MMLIKTTNEQINPAEISLPTTSADADEPTAAQARFINLKLITSKRGAKIRLAEQTQLNPSVISHILKQRYSMSDEVAFKIESAFRLPIGFLSQVHSVPEFPESMRELLIRDDLSSLADVLALITRQSVTLSEFEKLPSLQLAPARVGLSMQPTASPTHSGPLAQALCMMIAQKIEQHTLTEASALRLIQLLMNDNRPL